MQQQFHHFERLFYTYVDGIQVLVRLFLFLLSSMRNTRFILCQNLVLGFGSNCPDIQDNGVTSFWVKYETTARTCLLQ